MRLFLRCVSLTDRLLCISYFTYLFRRNITTYYFKSQPVASLNKPNASRVLWDGRIGWPFVYCKSGVSTTSFCCRRAVRGARWLVGGEQGIDLFGPCLQSADDVFDDDRPIGRQEGPHPLDGQLWVIATTADDVNWGNQTKKGQKRMTTLKKKTAEGRRIMQSKVHRVSYRDHLLDWGGCPKMAGS